MRGSVSLTSWTLSKMAGYKNQHIKINRLLYANNKIVKIDWGKQTLFMAASAWDCEGTLSALQGLKSQADQPDGMPVKDYWD